MQTKKTIAYIDDNPANLECVGMILQHNFELITFDNPSAFLKAFNKSSFEAILLDIHMPQIDGFTLYEKIIEHRGYNGCPILFISSDDSHLNRIRSYELGAVDFLSKDVSAEELVARIRSKIKFFEEHRSIIEFGSLRINLTMLKTYIEGKEVPLTFIELRLLTLLLRNYPDCIPKEKVLEFIWRNVHVSDNNLHTHIFNLNTKLSDWGYTIQIKRQGLQIVRG